MPEVERFTIGADVSCTDGPCGTLLRVALDPVAHLVTHLIVEPRRGHGPARPVPLGLVDPPARQIRLRGTPAEVGSPDPRREGEGMSTGRGHPHSPTPPQPPPARARH